MTSTRYSLPLAIALLFVLVLIGLGIRKEAYQAVAPPIYDPLGYIQKGKAVWSLVAHGDLARVLNASPTSRPPGFVPFCYPFGYQADFRSFLFWSTLSPIALWALSVFLALGKHRQTLGESILPFAWSLGLISLPMFYHFELSGVNETTFVGQWGLQDCLLASVAALATSVTVIGSRKRLSFLSILGWSIAAYCLFIKPAGLLVMFAVAGIWFVETTISALQNGPRSLNLWWLETRRYVLTTLLAGAAVFGLTIVFALSSEYLSENNIQLAKTALGVLISLSPLAVIVPTVISYVPPVLGWWWSITFGISYIAALAAGSWSLAKKRFAPDLLRPWGALMILLASGYWWIFMAGLQARYYFPFILIVMIWLLPDLVRRLQTFSPGWRLFLATPAFLATCILLSLLWSGQPKPSLERWLGVNLASGGFFEEVRLARQLMEEAQAAKRSLQIYAMPSNRVGVVFSVDYLSSISSGKPPLMNFTFVLDWTRAPCVRLEEILRSDYLFVEEDDHPVSPVKIETFDQEVSVYQAWVRSLDEECGISWVKRGRLNVLRVRNAQKLRVAFRQFVAQHQWRNVFIQNNAEVFPKE
jgi:hypothetical protein